MSEESDKLEETNKLALNAAAKSDYAAETAKWSFWIAFGSLAVAAASLGFALFSHCNFSVPNEISQDVERKLNSTQNLLDSTRTSVDELYPALARIAAVRKPLCSHRQ